MQLKQVSSNVDGMLDLLAAAVLDLAMRTGSEDVCLYNQDHE